MKKFCVVVCGTKYGQAYLSAFISENPQFRLVGILAKGSTRSQQHAKELGVPLYTKVDEIPSDTDIACVAVRSTIMGGEGTNLALQIMKRGIHVIQEHPVHPGDIRKCLKQAKDSGVCYHINSHFVNVEPVRIFIDYIKRVREHENLLFIDATTALLYSLIDILGRALGSLRPYGFGRSAEWESSLADINKNDVLPFRCLQGIVAGIPITLKYQNYYDSTDSDKHLLVMHRICIGMVSGNVTLLNTHGPVIWSKAHHAPEYKEQGDVAVSPLSDRKRFFAAHHNVPTTVSFSGDKSFSISEIELKYWPDGICFALNQMREEILTGSTCPGQSADYILDVSEMWMEVARRFGSPHMLSLPPLPDPFPDPQLYREEVLSKKIGLEFNVPEFL
jgi:thiazolinyl imide reductase